MYSGVGAVARHRTPPKVVSYNRGYWGWPVAPVPQMQKGKIAGMGEYFAPAAGMGEYFSGVGADAVTACSPECASAMDTKRKTQLSILVPGGIAVGLLVGMFVFR